MKQNNYNISSITVILLFICESIQSQQWESPCPKLFQYDTRNPKEPGKWFGKLTLISDIDIVNGVFLVLIFSKPPIQIGTQFGDKIFRLKPTEFMIQDPDYTLYANMPVQVRFFVKHNKSQMPPRLLGFRINARKFCPEHMRSGFITEEDMIATGEELSVLQNHHSVVGIVNNINSSIINRPKIKSRKPETVNNNPIIRPILELPDIPCGTVAQRPIGLISFGEQTSEGQWPWHAAIYSFVHDQMRYSCGGSLISKKHILTASHCVTQPRTTEPLKLEFITVYLGKYKLDNFGTGIQERKVSKISIHPKFTFNVLFNDIAILTLVAPVKFTEFVRPVCIWDDYTAVDIVHDRIGIVVGWGFDENKQLSNVLKEVEMPVVPHAVCILSNTEFFSKVVTDNNYCAGFRNGSAPCNGDSGGGMVFPKQGTSGANAIWQIRGLVSIGVSLQGQYICDNKQYIVFTDVAKYLNWIYKVIKE